MVTVFVVEYEVEYEENFGDMYYHWEIEKIFKSRESAEKYIAGLGGLDRRIEEHRIFD